tara:strand:- start:717 stop:1379 length:663 start_codon:yes stop_codon:yes gene_type:complete
MAAIENINGLSLATGIEYSWTVQQLSESSGVDDDRYFYDFGTKLVYYKNADGDIIKAFDKKSAIHSDASTTAISKITNSTELTVDLKTISVPAGTLQSDGDSVTLKFHGRVNNDGATQPNHNLTIIAFGVEAVNKAADGVYGHNFVCEIIVYRKSNTVINIYSHLMLSFLNPNDLVYKSNETLTSTTLTANDHDFIIRGTSTDNNGIEILGSSVYTTKVL